MVPGKPNSVFSHRLMSLRHATRFRLKSLPVGMLLVAVCAAAEQRRY